MQKIMEPIGQKVSHWAASLIEHDAPAQTPPPQTLWAFMKWALQGAWRAIGFGFVVNATAGVVDVLMMLVLGAVVQTTVSTPPALLFSNHWSLFLGGILLLLVIRPMVFGGAGLMQSVSIGPNLANLILARLHRHTLGQPVRFFDNDFAGRIAQKQMQTARALTDVVVETNNAGTFAVSAVLATGAVAAALHPLLLVILVVWLGMYGAFMRFFMPRIRVLSAARAGARATVSGQVVDTITNIKTVKLFAQSQHEDAAAIGAMSNFRDRSVEWGEVTAMFRMGLVFIAGLLPVALLGASLWFWAYGMINAGQMTAIGAISLRLAQMTGWVSWTLLTAYANVGEVEDGVRSLTTPHGLTNRVDAKDVASVSPEICFEQVDFAYGTDTGGVRAVDLRIKAGEKVGFVGASGAGKSTLVALLLRLYDPEQGRITVGGYDLRDITQESLRKQIGLVTQETEMFNRSARENIIYGRPDASDEEIQAAVQKAEAAEFIANLRDHTGKTGFDARLGERGVKLSGGQRQRIALARALLKDAPILVLDEATSALDSEVEAHIQKALSAAMEGKTVVAIAHRLSTIADMDRIIVLDQGRIVEEGDHESLLAKGGLYARYWARQSGGFIGSDAPMDEE